MIITTFLRLKELPNYPLIAQFFWSFLSKFLNFLYKSDLKYTRYAFFWWNFFRFLSKKALLDIFFWSKRHFCKNFLWKWTFLIKNVKLLVVFLENWPKMEKIEYLFQVTNSKKDHFKESYCNFFQNFFVKKSITKKHTQ